jgi:hypothetical protein
MLAHKAIRTSYYWPYMNEDSTRVVPNCDKCQSFAKVMKNAQEELSLVLVPWPFAQWGVDIVGPLPREKEAASSWLWR